MTLTITDLITRWNTDEGKPYKGSLIDWRAYTTAPDSIGCMCAQGQVLHLLGGWTPDRLRDVPQAEADAATAKLLNISRAHAVLLRTINDKSDGAPAVVMTDPSKVLGNQWGKVLDLWAYLDGMTGEQWAAAWASAGAAARAATWAAAGAATWAAAGAAARAAAMASWEIQGAEIMRRDEKPFFFLRAFGFASPDDIPTRPADYGITAARGTGE